MVSDPAPVYQPWQPTRNSRTTREYGTARRSISFTVSSIFAAYWLTDLFHRLCFFWAAAAAVQMDSKSLKDLRIAEIMELDMQLEDGQVRAYRATVKVSFKYRGGARASLAGSQLLAWKEPRLPELILPGGTLLHNESNGVQNSAPATFVLRVPVGRNPVKPFEVVSMRRILLVDDERGSRALCRLELEDEGFEVKTAADSAETETILQTWEPDLVILDIRLGQDNGLGLLRRLVETRPSTPTILYSEYTSYRGDFNSWLADAFLRKSSDLSELKRTVRTLLSSHREG